MLSKEIKNNIIFSTKWARYGAIISFINLGLGLLQLIVGFMSGNPFIFFNFLFFLISGIITWMLALNLLKYAKLSIKGIEQENSVAFYQSLYHLRFYFTVIAVLFLIVLLLLLIILLFGLIAMIISFTK